MEWRPAGWSVCLPLLISPCTIKSRSTLLAPAHPGGPGKRAVKRLWYIGQLVQAKFYCLHALANGNQCIRIRQKMRECSSQWCYLHHLCTIASLCYFHSNLIPFCLLKGIALFNVLFAYSVNLSCSTDFCCVEFFGC